MAAELLDPVPGAGAVTPAPAGTARDVDVAGPDPETPMRHRAPLLALPSALRPHLRAAAVTTSTVTTSTVTTSAVTTGAVGFGGVTALAMTTAGGNGALTGVAPADVVGLPVPVAGARLGRERT